MTAAIEAHQLTKRFSPERVAVDRLDLRVEQGQVYALLGPNGAGKSTTIHMLTTLLRPTAGSASICGLDLATRSSEIRRSIGVALQDVALDPLLTGLEHLRLQADLHGLSRKARTARIEDLTDAFDLAAFVRRRVRDLSGGMRRRLDLALALLHDPTVLFLDEPTTGLDPESRGLLWETVRRLQREGLAILLTTQYLEEADVLAERIGIAVGGRLVAENTPEALKHEVGSSRVEIALADEQSVAAACAALQPCGHVEHDEQEGRPLVRVCVTEPSVPQLVRALDDAGVCITSLTVRHPTIEDVYLAYVRAERPVPATA